jgi:SAM-dependent methyltransferase
VPVGAASESREAALARLRPWVERAEGFSGWSFDLEERRLGPALPWSYEGEVRRLARGATAVLDLGTGGGERLASLRDGLPSRVVATEEWHVNAPVARERLAPLGVEVVRARSLALPFAEGAFDLVIDRHEELEASEIERVLRPGGTFVTQQVGRGNWQELRPHFPRATDWGDLLGRYASELRGLGFAVETREHATRVAYPSLGEFVYMLAVASWTIPAFDLEADLDALLALEADCLRDEEFVVTEDRYLIIARKPG